MNYIDQITKYFTEIEEPEKIPFVLLSAKTQAINQGHYLNSLSENAIARHREMDDLDLDELIIWSQTREGREYWKVIYTYTYKGCGEY